MADRMVTKVLTLARLVSLLLLGAVLLAQGDVQPTNTPPNTYRTVADYFRMPEGRKWGSTSAVEIDKDGRSIWVAERCGANTCTGSTLPSVLKFDASGKLVASFGAGTLIFPHGIHVDRDGNVWVTDGQDNAPRPARGGGGGGGAAAPGGAAAGAAPSTAGAGASQTGRGTPPPAPRANPAPTKGHQGFKFSPDGKL